MGLTVSKLYVTYFIAQPLKVAHRIERSSGNVRSQFPVEESDRIAEIQMQEVNKFVDSQAESQVLDTFVETPENTKTDKWPKLELALEACKNNNATLVIAELGTLTNNESFSAALLESKVNFYCCDQPFVNAVILEALHKHAQVQRRRHGELIRAGLKKTSAKSGNPNAAKVIARVNKPKIDVAIVFAFLLQLIVGDYKRKGFSQRQMVKSLNEEGFTAPEGGKWVLSQLQKVLDRVRLNEIAREVRPIIDDLQLDTADEMAIASELNSRSIQSLKRSSWDEIQVKKLLARLEQIKEIELINDFVLDLLPIIHAYRERGLSSVEMIAELEKAGCPVRGEQVEAIA